MRQRAALRPVEINAEPARKSPDEPGVVAAERLCQRTPRHRHRHRRSPRLVAEARARRVDRAARTERRCSSACRAVRSASAGDRGRRQGAPAAEGRAVWRRALRRRAHRADRRRPDRVRRDPYLRRPRLCRLGPAWRVDLLRRPCARAASRARRAVARRGLHPLRDPRLHRRQLSAGDREHSGARSTRSRTTCSPTQRAARGRSALHAAARPAAPAQRRRCRSSMSASGSSTPR